MIEKADFRPTLDDLNDLIETKWTEIGPVGQTYFKGRYEFHKSLIRKKIAELNAAEKKPKPKPTAAEKRVAADTFADAKKRERGELLLKLGVEYGDARVEQVIADLNIDWHAVPDKYVRIVRLILKHGSEKVNGESQKRWQAPPRYLGLEQVAELEGALA